MQDLVKFLQSCIIQPWHIVQKWWLQCRTQCGRLEHREEEHAKYTCLCCFHFLPTVSTLCGNKPTETKPTSKQTEKCRGWGPQKKKCPSSNVGSWLSPAIHLLAQKVKEQTGEGHACFVVTFSLVRSTDATGLAPLEIFLCCADNGSGMRSGRATTVLEKPRHDRPSAFHHLPALPLPQRLTGNH